ncbi:MAG TPA: glycosyltransferase family 39 protein, partial [Pyrinomonadaceae bacterium]
MKPTSGNVESEQHVIESQRITTGGTLNEQSPTRTTRSLQTVLVCAAIFLSAAGVRILHWQDNRQAVPFYGMTGEYKAHALVLAGGDFRQFIYGPNPPSDANVVKHPPGYPILMAAVYKIFGTSDARLQLVHIFLDALAALLVFFLALEMLPTPAASVAGFLVAFSPQLAYHSIALLPDPLAAPTLLLAFYLLLRASKEARLMTTLAAGAAVGVSCWLRSNALLLPLFMAALAPLLFARGQRVRHAAAVLCAALLVIAPVTIRNAVAFKHFIPLSLSAGITLVEGIGVYDREGRFGLPSTDYEVTRWEARELNRPDYLGTRFSPDGIERERFRVSRGLAVVRAHPFWFLKVML